MTKANHSDRTRSGFDARTGILRFSEFENYPHVVVAMTGRAAPALAGEREFNMHPEVGPDRDHAVEHRALAAKELGVELDDTIWFDPDERGPVQWVGAERLGAGATDWSTRIRGASGLAAQCTNLALCTLCNDNVCVVLLDPTLFSLAVVTIDKENPSGAPIREAAALLVERGEADPKEMIGFVAPGLGPCCYKFHDPSVPGNRNNLWDLVRTAMMAAGLVRSRILNPRLCTGCRDSEFFTRHVDGPETGAGALTAGVMDRNGSLVEVVAVRKKRAMIAKKSSRRKRAPQAPSLSEEEARLNAAIRCPYGRNKVYIRSEILGGIRGVSEPEIFLRCEVMAVAGLAEEGYNIVPKGYIETYCAGDFEACAAYQAYRKQTRG